MFYILGYEASTGEKKAPGEENFPLGRGGTRSPCQYHQPQNTLLGRRMSEKGGVSYSSKRRGEVHHKSCVNNIEAIFFGKRRDKKLYMGNASQRKDACAARSVQGKKEEKKRACLQRGKNGRLKKIRPRDPPFFGKTVRERKKGDTSFERGSTVRNGTTPRVLPHTTTASSSEEVFPLPGQGSKKGLLHAWERLLLPLKKNYGRGEQSYE